MKKKAQTEIKEVGSGHRTCLRFETLRKSRVTRGLSPLERELLTHDIQETLARVTDKPLGSGPSYLGERLVNALVDTVGDILLGNFLAPRIEDAEEAREDLWDLNKYIAARARDFKERCNSDLEETALCLGITREELDRALAGETFDGDDEDSSF